MGWRKRLAAVFALPSILLPPPTVVVAATAATDPHLTILAVHSTADHQISIVCELEPKLPRPLPPSAVSVTSDGTRPPIRVSRLLSDQPLLGLVMDASADGESSLRSGIRAGAASFLLQLPPDASTALIADRRPPAVLAPRSVGVADALQATSALKGSGPRATSAALTLALRTLRSGPDTAAPIIVLYTKAPNAGGESAADLGARLRRANAVLAVVNASPDPRYWLAAATSTGGFAISASPDQAITSFDEVADGLRSRYMVTFPRPTAGPVQANVRVNTGRKVITAAVSVPADPFAVETSNPPATDFAASYPQSSDTDSGGAQTFWLWLLGVGLLAVVVVAGIVLRLWSPETGRLQGANASSGLVRRSALPGVRVFDVADPAGPHEITNMLFEPRSERDARSQHRESEHRESGKKSDPQPRPEDRPARND